MHETLQAALEADLALTTQEEPLIHKARELYSKGLTPQHISATQMAALGECIRLALSFEQARSDATDWLTKQMKKLQSREERGERPSSWRVLCTTDAGKATLGETLIDWLRQQRYHPPTAPAEGQRLALLQRFWSRLYSLYRYEAALGKPMRFAPPPAKKD